MESLEPELLERGSTRLLLLPLEWTDPERPGCTTVAVLGAPSTGFVLRFLASADARRWERGEFPEQSMAGAAQLVRCGQRKEMLRRLAIEMRSPRGVIEVVLARSAAPFPSLRRTLRHRDPGPPPPAEHFGPNPSPESLQVRIEGVERRRRREGAVEVRREVVPVRRDGAGQALVKLIPGCHWFDALAAPPPPEAHRGVDLDMELRWALTEHVVAVDQTAAVDATARVCLGKREVGRLTFVGSLPGVPLVLVHSHAPLPDGIPERWEPEARGRMAEAIREHHRRPLPGSPIFESIGIAGVTAIPVEVEPGACYVAAVAATRGRSAAIALAAATDEVQAQNHGGVAGQGTAVAFCSRAAETALLEVDATGAGLAWHLAVWQTGRVAGSEALR